MSASGPQPVPDPEEEARIQAAAAGPRRAWIPYAAAAGLLAVLVAMGVFLWHRTNHVYVSDARIGAGMITVSSRVPGWVARYHVETADRVAVGDPLVSIDSREAVARLVELDARLETIEAEAESLAARIDLVDEKTRRTTEAQRALLEAAEASLAAASSARDLAQAEFSRASSLLERRIIAQQKWDAAKAAHEKARQDWAAARANVDSATAALHEAEAERQQLLVMERERETLQHRLEEVRAQRERQALSLGDHDIRSPIAGVVDKTFADDGEYVRPGQRLLLIHDPHTVWVDANVRETQIRHLRLGQPARITVDAWPGETFQGTITRIGDAATSEFALLPSPNPSGNFTKITQRIPVRIALEQRERKLGPGMMVEVDVDIRRR